MDKRNSPALPDDLVFDEILPKLPVKCLMRLKCVSKNWSTRISTDSSFIAAHLNHHSNSNNKVSIIIGNHHEMEHDKRVLKQRLVFLSQPSMSMSKIDMAYLWNWQERSTIVGSCHGLVCLQLLTAPQRLVLWNPATRKRRYLTLPNSGATRHRFGFGIDPESSSDYKIVRIAESRANNTLRRSVQVFSKRIARWTSELEDHNAWGWDSIQHLNVLANRGLHWVGLNEDITRSRYCILSFDLRDEVFQVTEFPEHGAGDCHLFLCKWKESLGALTHPRRDECFFWMNKSTRIGDKKYSYCWSKMFRVVTTTTLYRQSIRGVWNDQLLVVDKISGLTYELSFIDPLTGKRRYFETSWLAFNFFSPYDYVESLVPVV